MKTNRRKTPKLETFKYLLAVLSFSATVALWSLFSNQEKAGDTGQGDGSGLNTSQLDYGLPTLVPLEFSGKEQLAAESSATGDTQLRSVSAPAPQQASGGNGPVVVQSRGGSQSGGAAVTTTRSSQ